MPVNHLKIDGSFVHDMSVNPVNRAMVESNNQIAHVLCIKTIAEWAEDDSTIDVLGEVGVDFVQGHAIGTPLPIVDRRTDAAGAASARAATHG